MEGFDKFVIVIDIADIVQLLQYKMTGIVKNIDPRMFACGF